MLVQIITENGQKKVIPLTADTGAGNPVGTIIVVCSNQIPSNYLPLGTQYNTTLYPILYALLGTDTTPTASALGLPILTSGQYAIKATSGLSENAQDNVINTLNEERSYSTEEHLTGKKWIDGKPIYKKTFTGATSEAGFNGVASLTSLNIDKVTNIEQIYENNDYVLTHYYYGNSNCYRAIIRKSDKVLIVESNDVGVNFRVTLEYTKS